MTAQTQPAQPKTPGYAADGKTPIYSIVGVGIVVRADEFNRLHAENEQLRAERDEERESTDEWRRLALQFDGHRMQALGHLRVMLKNPFDHCLAATEFLAAPPLSGEEVLAQRLAQLRESKPLSDEQALAIVHNFCLNVGDWDRNGLSVLRATEAAHGIGEKTP